MRIIIAGAGEVGSHLAKMLSNESNDITVIDSDQSRLDALASNTDIVTVTGSSSEIKVLKEAGVADSDLFIAVNPSESQDVNIISAILAKKLGSHKVTARINTEEYLSYENKNIFTEMGIDLLFYPEKIAAGEIIDLLKHNASTDSMDFARGRVQMSVFKVEEDSPLLDMNVFDLSRYATSEDLQFRVIAISRNNTTIIPKVDTKFKYHDLIYIISKREGIKMLMKLIGAANLEVDKVMILGGSHTAEMVAQQLIGKVSEIKIIDQDKERCLELTETFGSEVSIVNADGRNSDMLIEEDIRSFDAFVALTGSSEANILACVAAKKLGIPRTIAEVENIEYIRLAEGMGVDAVINKKLITAGRIFKFTLSDKVRFIKYMNGTNAEVLEYIVTKDARITEAPLMNLDFPKDAIIGGIIRGNKSYIAVGSTHIQEYDRVVVFALPEAVREVDKFFR